MEGWIKLHRKLVEWEWYTDVNTTKLFLHLILIANHKDKRYRGKLVKRGTMLTSREKLSIETGLTERQIRTSLNKLKSTNELTINSSRQGTVIKVVKYNDYQIATNDLTEERPTSDQRATSNNNDNNDNKYYTDNFLLSEVEAIDSSKLTAKNKLSYHILTGLVARVYKEIDEKLKTKMTAEPIVDTIRKLIKIDKFSDKDIILVLAYLKFKDQFWLTQGMPSFASARKKKDGQTKFEKIHFKATSETKRDEQFYEKVKKQIQWYETQLNK